MTELSVATLGVLIVWGTVVALDLVSVPQALLSRPVVAGSVAGWIVGDPVAGLRVGVLLELFALDVLPIGAVRDHPRRRLDLDVLHPAADHTRLQLQ